MANLDHHPTGLIIVPGHALFQPRVIACPEDPSEAQHWLLQPFQADEQRKYIEHIEGGIDTLSNAPGSKVLMFSGGRTRHEFDKWSEGSTYLSIAEQSVRRSSRAHLLGMMAAEEFARDSLENIACSRALFYFLFGCYPLQTTVIGWEFKRTRFTFHAETLGIPDSLVYIGRNNPKDMATAEAAEKTTLDAFREFPFGTAGILLEKRNRRTFSSSPPPFVDYLPPPLSSGYTAA